jgi:hypothetical protein
MALAKHASVQLRLPCFRDLGKHTTWKGCLYIKRLSDVDLPTLKKLIEEVVKQGGQNGRTRSRNNYQFYLWLQIL